MGSPIDEKQAHGGQGPVGWANAQGPCVGSQRGGSGDGGGCRPGPAIREPSGWVVLVIQGALREYDLAIFLNSGNCLLSVLEPGVMGEWPSELRSLVLKSGLPMTTLVSVSKFAFSETQFPHL